MEGVDRPFRAGGVCWAQFPGRCPGLPWGAPSGLGFGNRRIGANGRGVVAVWAVVSRNPSVAGSVHPAPSKTTSAGKKGVGREVKPVLLKGDCRSRTC